MTAQLDYIRIRKCRRYAIFGLTVCESLERRVANCCNLVEVRKGAKRGEVGNLGNFALEVRSDGSGPLERGKTGCVSMQFHEALQHCGRSLLAVAAIHQHR